jgi:hypothetical protein
MATTTKTALAALMERATWPMMDDQRGRLRDIAENALPEMVDLLQFAADFDCDCEAQGVRCLACSASAMLATLEEEASK